MIDRELVTYPTWERYTVLSHVIFSLSIKDRRNIFHLCKHTENTAEAFFPQYGITFAEFAIWYTLGENKRKTKRG